MKTLESILPSVHRGFYPDEPLSRSTFEQQLAATASLIGESVLRAWSRQYATDDNPQIFPGLD